MVYYNPLNNWAVIYNPLYTVNNKGFCTVEFYVLLSMFYPSQIYHTWILWVCLFAKLEASMFVDVFSQVEIINAIPIACSIHPSLKEGEEEEKKTLLPLVGLEVGGGYLFCPKWCLKKLVPVSLM